MAECIQPWLNGSLGNLPHLPAYCALLVKQSNAADARHAALLQHTVSGRSSQVGPRKRHPHLAGADRIDRAAAARQSTASRAARGRSRLRARFQAARHALQQCFKQCCIWS